MPGELVFTLRRGRVWVMKAIKPTEYRHTPKKVLFHNNFPKINN
jgi:hypothetical protein